MKIVYTQKRFSPQSLGTIRMANEILDEYAAQGFDLTLRQLYYQFVSRGLIANKDTEYKRLGSIVNDARLAGLIDWDSIVDRTRTLRSLPHWATPGSVIRSAATGYKNDLWRTQPARVEVWIEKDALVGVIAGVCNELDVPFFSCRGYTSQSEMWSAGQRLGEHLANGQRVKILHLGDHDPSGIDMSRDIEERLFLFLATDRFHAQADLGVYDPEGEHAVQFVNENFSVDRIALTMEQIDLYNPPPNPAKLTDSRGAGYVDLYGYESWELDALDPTMMADLIRTNVEAEMDMEAWDEAVASETTDRTLLLKASSRWGELVDFLAEDNKEE